MPAETSESPLPAYTDVVPFGQTALRLTWAHLPPELRDEIGRRCGSRVVEAQSRDSGFTPGFASVLVCEDGSRHFVKAASVKGSGPSRRRTARRRTSSPPCRRGCRRRGCCGRSTTTPGWCSAPSTTTGSRRPGLGARSRWRRAWTPWSGRGPPHAPAGRSGPPGLSRGVRGHAGELGPRLGHTTRPRPRRRRRRRSPPGSRRSSPGTPWFTPTSELTTCSSARAESGVLRLELAGRVGPPGSTPCSSCSSPTATGCPPTTCSVPSPDPGRPRRQCRRRARRAGRLLLEGSRRAGPPRARRTCATTRGGCATSRWDWLWDAAAGPETRKAPPERETPSSRHRAQRQAACFWMADLRFAAWFLWMTPAERLVELATRGAGSSLALSVSPAAAASRNWRTAVFSADFTDLLRCAQPRSAGCA